MSWLVGSVTNFDWIKSVGVFAIFVSCNVWIRPAGAKFGPQFLWCARIFILHLTCFLQFQWSLRKHSIALAWTKFYRFCSVCSMPLYREQDRCVRNSNYAVNSAVVDILIQSYPKARFRICELILDPSKTHDACVLSDKAT